MKNQEKGFALVILIIALAIIAVIAGIFLSRPNGKPSVIQTGNNAIEQTKKNNTVQKNRQLEIQKDLDNPEK